MLIKWIILLFFIADVFDSPPTQKIKILPAPNNETQKQWRSCEMFIFVVFMFNMNFSFTIGKYYVQLISVCIKFSPTLRDPDTRSTFKIHTHRDTD